MTTKLTVVVGLTLLLAGCASEAARTPPSPSQATVRGPEATEPIAPAVGSTPSPEATDAPVAFPTEAFATISEDPVSEELAAALQAALATHDVTSGGGMSATVMTPEGTWSGTTGKADGVRDLQVDDHFAIASITKTVVAAQVLLMVEAGELGLDDPVADHLPADLEFDTNGATVRELLGHRSGIPDDYDVVSEAVEGDPLRVLKPSEVLSLIPEWRTVAGSSFEYSGTNYLLLTAVIEHLSGRPLAEALRNGVLAIDGLERLVLQTAERPTEPMAAPAGASRDVLETNGGYLPSLALAAANPGAGSVASDSRSLARWFRALCAGEIISQASLTEMSQFQPVDFGGPYGLGMYNPAHGYAEGYGHTGQLPGFMSWAACLPEMEAVIVVLTNHEVADGHFAYSHGLGRPLVDALRSP